ncbi:RNA dependent RNA polymerase [Pseudobacteroides cellulosolvens]|uniref:Uncharacterized protein n=1 Tax=Pseudobacteroides cellulosolvens ATCC 35603 = DSM 2933 TaxID=398512 RepID=A0A0L6JKG0_9FIRM|nr:hypothetical protein [Pseudobacteroides cellulosolvens]KNY26346.1 hypothetical protein Bccel_1608 [Pseudobacteroides cellulosolvens ATCC 35603 = DSM 2933]
MMNKQVKLFMLDVKDFYTSKESELNKKYLETKKYKKLIEEHTKLSMLEIITESLSEYKVKKELYESLKSKTYNKDTEMSDEEIKQLEELKKYFNAILKSADVKRSKKFRLSDKDKDTISDNENKLSLVICEDCGEVKDKCKCDKMKSISIYKKKLKSIKEYKDCKDNIKKLHKEFEEERKSNVDLVRTLERDRLYFKYKDKDTGEEIEKVKVYKQIALFDSFLTRTLDLKYDELTEEIFIIETVYYDIIEQLVKNGFKYLGNTYCVFTSSAGQLRKKKVVMIKESTFNTFKKKLMCGLILDDINSYIEIIDDEEYKGCIVNKYLTYLALTNSASSLWEGFDISKAIVIPDFETEVTGIVDYIDNKTFEITLNDNRSILINHSDGAGLYITDSEIDNAFQCRLPWMKGLMIPVNKKSLLEYCSSVNKYIIRDLDGVEWDLQKHDIRYIFTKSQFKMYKYYKHLAKKSGNKTAWKTYQDYFIELECEACKLNIEPDTFLDKEINYQFLQSLTNMTETEVNILIKSTYDEIKDAYNDTDTMLEMLGATKINRKRNALQDALLLYPELLHDYHVQDMLSGAINSRKKKAKAGKFIIENTKRMFLCPDVFAWLEYLISGNKNPEGLLKDGQVSCMLYDDGVTLDILRSPSLYREHAINTNLIDDNTQKWFITNCIYTSCHTIMSKLLMYDVDGDEATVISDSTWTKVAEEAMKGINPLYYELGTGKPEEINNDSIWESMKLAWEYGNIGIYSNRLTKIWNIDGINDNALTLAKKICFINNASIDAAKTKYFPKIPEDLKIEFKILDKLKNPHFFIYAKNKKESQVEEINGSVVNKVCKKFEDIKDNEFTYDFSKIGKFYIKNIMNNPEINETEVYKTYGEAIINKYEEMNETKNKWFIKVKDTNLNDSEEETIINKSSIIYSQCKQEILSVVSKDNDCRIIDIVDIVDILIKYVYSKHKDRCKSLLWTAFGDVIVGNIKLNKKTFMCLGCGRRYKKKSNNQKRCEKCSDKNRKEKDKLRKKK